MAHPAETRKKLRQLYVAEHQSLEVAAQLCGISFATARRWRDDAKADGDDWNEKRAIHTVSGGNLEEIARESLAEFLFEHRRTMQMLRESDTEEITPPERIKMFASIADSFNKIMAANTKLLPATQATAVVLKVVQLLLDHISEVYPEKLADFTLILQTFEKVIEREFA